MKTSVHWGLIGFLQLLRLAPLQPLSPSFRGPRDSCTCGPSTTRSRPSCVGPPRRPSAVRASSLSRRSHSPSIPARSRSTACRRAPHLQTSASQGHMAGARLRALGEHADQPRHFIGGAEQREEERDERLLTCMPRPRLRILHCSSTKGLPELPIQAPCSFPPQPSGGLSVSPAAQRRVEVP